MSVTKLCRCVNNLVESSSRDSNNLQISKIAPNFLTNEHAIMILLSLSSLEDAECLSGKEVVICQPESRSF